jgi:COP9 signalosome complex subunit 2
MLNLAAVAFAGYLQDGKLQDALDGFQKVLDMQSETKGEWGFKALKQTAKVLFRQSRYEDMMKRYQELLEYLHVVTKNQSEKVMTKIVDFVSGSPDLDFLEKFYDTTVGIHLQCILLATAMTIVSATEHSHLE